MRAVHLGTVPIECQRMLRNIETALAGDVVLALLDFLIVEFLDPAAFEADQMIMMRAFIEFEDCLT